MKKVSNKFKDFSLCSISITKKMILVVIGIIFAILFTTILCSKLLLPQMYMNNKVKNFETMYSEIDVLSKKKDYQETDNIKLFKEFSATNNCSIYLLQFNKNSELNLVYPYAIENSVALNIKKKAIDYYKDGFFSDNQTIRKTYKFEGESIKEKITDTGNYRIYKVFDKSVNSYYLELLGLYHGSDILYFRSNLNSMKEALDSFQNLLIVVCCITGLLGILMVYVFLNSITKPLLELSESTKDIANFEFDKVKPSNRLDEIGTLTNSIYFLSTQLKEKIQEIKLKNIKLKQDIQQKEEIDTLRKEFISNISHELKTPISIIQGYAEGLQESVDEVDSKDFYCEVILDEANKMNGLVRKMLALNKLEFGNTLIDCSEFDLKDLLESLLKSSHVLFEEKNIQVETNFIPAKIYSDEFLLEDVFINYLTNACNHCENEMKIKIKIEEISNCYRVSVFNTGKQIPEDSLDKVWIKFYKVDKARSRMYGGSGIGLSIVKTTMNLLDGECGVQNEKDGVTFWFQIKK